MSIYDEKFSHEININPKNNKIECEKFLVTLINDVKIFKKNHSNYKKEFISIKKSKKIFYTPERILNSSPLTIIDGQWGSGKTFFLEQLCELVVKKEVKLNYIDKIILIDAWKYSSSSLIPTDFITYLINQIIVGYKWKKIIKNALISVINVGPLSVVNKILYTDFKFKKIKELEVDKAIKILNKHINKPTMIILDNIERVGDNWWDIIKIIQKLVVLDNFIFILPTFKDKLNFNKLTEWSIDKYLTIPMYKIKSNYCGILSNFFDEEYTKILNDILNKPIINECLNLRQLENILKNNKNYEKLKNKYQVLIWFERIWNPRIYENHIWISEIEKLINKDIKELTYICHVIANISSQIINGNDLRSIDINLIEFRNDYFDIWRVQFEYRFLSDNIFELQNKINEINKNNNLSEKKKYLINWINSKVLYIKNNRDFSYLNKMSKYVYKDLVNNVKNNNDWIQSIINKIKEEINF